MGVVDFQKAIAENNIGDVWEQLVGAIQISQTVITNGFHLGVSVVCVETSVGTFWMTPDSADKFSRVLLKVEGEKLRVLADALSTCAVAAVEAGRTIH
ncbi:MAG: hypothetical protein COB78_05825 [Hyphomicrobiales bacterium]|nr:MAG: hypothetical protein COB78_05825 [Hyphomicrobiales bacterium]